MVSCLRGSGLTLTCWLCVPYPSAWSRPGLSWDLGLSQQQGGTPGTLDFTHRSPQLSCDGPKHPTAAPANPWPRRVLSGPQWAQLPLPAPRPQQSDCRPVPPTPIPPQGPRVLVWWPQAWAWTSL